MISKKFKHRIEQTLIALDQLANAFLAAGWADETLSARAWRLDGTKPRWTWARRIIDLIFFWQKNHCEQAYLTEQERLQLPPEYRTPEYQNSHID